ncbi:hypothetical protein CYY_000951 [Polysphondylium violaceum]|uniref:Hyaluronan/mRNA-binding protein domain-containing protein n=1 Tax=Polysphondylium violaceum TaxID=133409 RepID=A0A8J4Q2Q9_9MYCE|nr:hypothetical protein CYY_000951 [Polysphondylium violaceum]
MNKVNLFDLLQDEEEQIEKTTTKEVKVAAAPSTKIAAPKKVVSKDNKPAGKPENNGRQTSPKTRGTGPKRTNNAVEGGVVSEDKPNHKRDGKPHTHRPKTDAAGNVRGRTHERRSGTGRPINGENKRAGSGQGNWGKEGAIEEPVATESTEQKEQEEAAVPAVEDKTISFTDFLKQQQKENVALEAPKVRVAGEGEANQFAEYEPLEKVAAKTNNKTNNKEEKKGPKKTIVQVELRSASSRPPRKGQKVEKKAVSVDNNKDFPALTKA